MSHAQRKAAPGIRAVCKVRTSQKLLSPCKPCTGYGVNIGCFEDRTRLHIPSRKISVDARLYLSGRLARYTKHRTHDAGTLAMQMPEEDK